MSNTLRNMQHRKRPRRCPHLSFAAISPERCCDVVNPPADTGLANHGQPCCVVAQPSRSEKRAVTDLVEGVFRSKLLHRCGNLGENGKTDLSYDVLESCASSQDAGSTAVATGKRSSAPAACRADTEGVGNTHCAPNLPQRGDWFGGLGYHSLLPFLLQHSNLLCSRFPALKQSLGSSSLNATSDTRLLRWHYQRPFNV